MTDQDQHTDSYPPSWQVPPPGIAWPVQPAPPTTHEHSNQRQGGVLAALVAGLAALGKWGLFLLKFGKFGFTLLSMGLSLLIFAQRFGWVFGAGLLLLIFIHEMGHVLLAKTEGLPVSLPIFLGPFGAFVRMKQPPKDARQEAVVAIGGPVIGVAASIICLLVAQSLTVPGELYPLLLSLAFTGCLINLFNLIPFSPLDGGRVAGALSKWVNVVGLGILVALLLGFAGLHITLNPVLVVIVILGIFNIVHRFRQAKHGQEPMPLPQRTQVAIGVAYVSIVAISALGLTFAHNALIDGGYVPSPDSVAAPQ